MNPDEFQVNLSVENQTNESEPVSFCEICGYRFRYLKSLKRHISEQHPNDFPTVLPKKEKNLTCSMCFFEFKHLKNLVRHQKSKHKIALPYKRNRMCLICYTEVPSKTIISHYKEEHSIVMETVHLEFSSLEEFQKWKESEENENCSFYVKECGTKYFQDTVKDVYICHRSGKIRTRATGQRNLKYQGSHKIDGYCPSSISLCVFKSTGRCSVEFVKTHIGHTNDTKKLALTKRKITNKRHTIANKITSKETDVILNEAHDSNLGEIEKISNDSLFSKNSTNKNIDLNMYENLSKLNSKNKTLIKAKSSEQSSLSLKKEKLINEVSNYINSFTSEEEIQNFQKLILKSRHSKITLENHILRSNKTFLSKKFCLERKSVLRKQKIIRSKCLSKLNDPETSEITVIYLQPDNKNL